MVMQVALDTGVILDPVYSGKALVGLLKDMHSNPEEWVGSKVPFVHTGGLLGMYDKLDRIQPLVDRMGRLRRMPV